MADKTLYVDHDKEVWIVSDGGQNVPIPKLPYGTKPTWSFNVKSFASGSSVAPDLSTAAAWKAAVDYDHQHDTIAGALTAAKSGAVTVITVDGVATTPPLAGVINLTNGSGDTEGVGYTEWSLLAGVYTFVVDKTLSYSYAENDVVEIENTSPMVRILDADIDDTDADTGILLVTIDTRNNVFKNALADLPDLPCYIQLYGLDGSNIPIFSWKLPITAENSIDPAGGVPPAVTPGNYQYTGGTGTPDKTKRSKEACVDFERARWADSTLGGSAPAIKLGYGTANQYKLSHLSDASGSVASVDLSNCVAFQISASNIMQDATPPVRCVNDSIDSSEKATGILYAILDCRNDDFKAVVGTSSSDVNGWIQIYGFDASAVPVVSIRLPVIFENSVDPVGGTPPGVVGNFYTKSENDALLSGKANLSGSSDIEITDASKGIILKFGTQRIRARIDYTNSIAGWVFDVL